MRGKILVVYGLCALTSLVTSAEAFSFEAAETDVNAYESSNLHPYEATRQEVCESKLQSPQKLIFIFEGMAGYDPDVALQTYQDSFRRIRHMPSEPLHLNRWTPNALLTLVDRVIAREPNALWFYYSQDEWVQHGVSDAVKCATKLAAQNIGGQTSSLVVVGFSNGGRAAIEFAEALQSKKMKIDLAFTTDPVPKGHEMFLEFVTLGITNEIFFQRPKNVLRFVNYYQRHDSRALGLVGLRGHSVRGADIDLKIDPGEWLEQRDIKIYRRLDGAKEEKLLDPNDCRRYGHICINPVVMDKLETELASVSSSHYQLTDE